jgi:hypothetical protein
MQVSLCFFLERLPPCELYARVTVHLQSEKKKSTELNLMDATCMRKGSATARRAHVLNTD